MKYVPLLNFYIFLLMNNVRFLVIGETVEEDGYHTGAKQMRVNRAIHENYRPRHKYKAGTGHQGFLRRFARNNNDGPPCAVMYKNNEPVGILQPYEESYRFLPVRGEPTLVDINPIPVKRNSIVDVLYPSEMDDDDGRKERSNTAGFSDDKYPSVLAKFKIDSRLAKSWSPENYMKRSLFKREQNHEEQPREPANTEIKLEGVAVEDELKTILDDMGLIEDYPNRDVKRAIEDENLELGTNKIDLYKDEHTGSREKRDDSNTTETPNGIPPNTTARFVEAAASRMPQASDKVKLDEIDTVDEKRQVDDANDAAASSEDTTKDEIEYEGRSIHETRIERAIRDKIHKLKEEVKKEIDKLRGKTEEKQDEKKGEKKDENKGGKEERKKDEKKGDKNKPYSDDTRRKKRQTFNTLIQEEKKDIDPITFNDEDEKIHVRRKRNTDSDDVESSEAGVDVEERAAADLNNDASIDENIGVSKEDNSMSDSYRYDEFEFNNDNDESYEVAGDAVNDGTKTSDTYEKDSCNCDKTSNECKCSIPSLNSPQPSEGHEKSNVNFQEAASADSSKEHCSCDKHGNCRCINSILDNPQPGIDEDYAEDMNENDRDLSKLEIDKRDTKQHCSCNKNSNCKCESPLNEQSESQLNPGYSLEDRGDAYDAYAVETNDDDRETMSKRAVKPRKEAMKNFQSGEYFVDFNPDRYGFSSGKTFRRKRENFEDMVAMHGGGPVRAHLAAIRERSMVPVPRQRSARRVQKEENNSEPRQLIDMSDEDIFGALPQGFEGGLQRYKRVKRT